MVGRLALRGLGVKTTVFAARSRVFAAKRGGFTAQTGVFAAKRTVFAAQTGVFAAKRTVFATQTGVFAAKTTVSAAQTGDCTAKTTLFAAQTGLFTVQSRVFGPSGDLVLTEAGPSLARLSGQSERPKNELQRSWIVHEPSPLETSAHTRALAARQRATYNHSILSPSLRSIRWRLAILAVPLCACAAVLGIDDGYLRSGDDGGLTDGGPTDDGAPQGGDDAGDATVTYADAAGLDSALPVQLEPDGGVVPPACDPAYTTVDPKKGFFVAPGGVDAPSCTQAAPCATISHAIGLANDSPGTPNVYVAAGTYQEQLTLAAGVNVIGGWQPGTWARLCSQYATQVELLPAGSPSATVLANFNGKSTLSTLEIGSIPPTPPGTTVIGVYATGSSTTLNLSYVAISLFGGGDGTAGVTGNAGPSPAGSCPPGDGGTVAPAPGGKGVGADAGWFDPAGYVATTGGSGGSGAPGADGTSGKAGACIQCLTCTGAAVCTAGDAGILCGAQGNPGCGGGGGFGGVGGMSGGSSIALFVWGATVNLDSCWLTSGPGGNGGYGGSGGMGVAGSTGSHGAASTSECETACVSVNLSCGATVLEAADGGAAGGPGATGAMGGPGGDGAGGGSYAVVQGTGAKVTGSNTSLLQAGPAGSTPDGGNGAPGVSVRGIFTTP